MYANRPHIKIVPEPVDKKLEWCAQVLLVVMWLVIMYALFTLPNVIPVHFNFKGEADNYGHKLTLLILPVIGTCIYFGFSKLNNYPHLFNYSVVITEENAKRQYTIATRMLRYLKAAVLLLFTVIILLVYFTAKGVVHGLGWWFLPFVILLMVAPTIFFIRKSLKK